MSDLPPCKLCGVSPFAPSNPIKVASCNNAGCSLFGKMMSWDDWRILMSGPRLRRLREGEECYPGQKPPKNSIPLFHNSTEWVPTFLTTPATHILEGLPRPEEVGV